LYKSTRRALYYVIFIYLLSACSFSPVKKDAPFVLSDRWRLNGLSNWKFSGRIALQNHQESWSANIEWMHEEKQDKLLLTGPFGQGAVRITLQPELITFDYGDGRVESSKRVHEFIFQQLGFYMPALALRYWVVGLTAPDAAYIDSDDGFTQFGWDIHYQHFIPVDNNLMPRKIKVLRGSEKLKLIIDQWVING
jgi:outer membrane lipoprotein LolB